MFCVHGVQFLYFSSLILKSIMSIGCQKYFDNICILFDFWSTAGFAPKNEAIFQVTYFC